ncbi:alanine--tRNA ligase, partial [candidate division KSB1 bacterium]|nr:alanine--tRNA ligase [candidate division KSB1 bacterium]
NLDMHGPFIYKLVPVLVDIMGDAFPELKEKHQFVSLVIKSEEESFNSTLDRGIEIFEKITADVEKSGQKEIPGQEAFRLYDTYGFPLDLTQLMARQKNFSVDEKGFENAMSEQRDRARKAGKWSHSADFDYQNWQELSQGEDSKFLGYTELQCESEIRKFHIEDKQIFLILSQTPFYGEAGGQVGDVGEIVGDTFKIKIHDTVRDGSIFVHIGEFTESNKIDNSKVTARVDKTPRKSTARNHTATHLLHKALRETLGTHVTQAGSLVAPDHLRFDVSHFQKIAPQELEKIEARVNEKVRDDLAVKTLQKTYVEAREMGAMAIFEEKYGEYVRVVKIADFSMELCGGTHLNHTGEIGYFRILSESSAAAGIRRLEAVTGAKADTLLRKEKKLSHNLQEILNCSNEELVDKVQSLLSEKHRLEKEIQQLRVKSAQQDIGQLVNSAQSLDGFKIVTSQMASKTVDELKQISDTLRAKIGSGVGVLSSVINDKASFVCVVTDDLISGKNLKAGDIIKQVAAIADGSGGGRPHMALAGGKNINKIEQALEKVPEIVSAIINK